MVIADPGTVSSATAATPLDGLTTGDCSTDTLTGILPRAEAQTDKMLLSVGVPGFTPPPVICGYNTGQHMVYTYISVSLTGQKYFSGCPPVPPV